MKKDIQIALIAHDGKKPEMVAFVLRHKKFLLQTDIFATGTTGGHIEAAGFEVTKLFSGPQGGDAQIAAIVADGTMEAIIFFRDPLDKHPHEPDVQMLLRLCDVHNIPLATNPTSGDFIIKGIENEIKKRK